MSMTTQSLVRLAGRRLIGGSLGLACALPLLPFPAFWLNYFPDLVGITLLYWLIYQPHRVNFGVAFLVGVLTDMATHSLFGQHAMSYVVLTYFVLLLRPAYILMHGFMFQSILVGALLMSICLLNGLVCWMVDDLFIHITHFIPPVLSACIWPLFNKILLLVCNKRFTQRR